MKIWPRGCNGALATVLFISCKCLVERIFHAAKIPQYSLQIEKDNYVDEENEVFISCLVRRSKESKEQGFFRRSGCIRGAGAGHFHTLRHSEKPRVSI